MRNAGLRALLDVAGFRKAAAPNARQVAFRIGPRINAAGRMASASDVIEMFLTSDVARAKELASKLHDLNADRQQTEAEIVAPSCEQIKPVDPTECALVFARPKNGIAAWSASWPAAWWIACRPSSCWDAISRWLGVEARAAASAFHLLDGLESMARLFVRFGHAHAASALSRSPTSRSSAALRLRRFASARADFLGHLEIDASA